MKLMVMTQAVYPDEATARARLWIFLASCKRAGIEPHLYGIGKPFNTDNWKAMQHDYQIEYLKSKAKEFTHVLYSDGGDALVVGTLKEILIKYEILGCPPIVTAAFEGYGPEVHPSPHPGGYLAEIDAMIEALNAMYTLPRQTLNNCWYWHDAWEDGSFMPWLDTHSDIFHVHGRSIRTRQHWTDGPRPFRGDTKAWPAIVHFPGGYQDPVAWKDEMMTAVAKEYGIL